MKAILISLEKFPEMETNNWIIEESSKPKIGDEFKVIQYYDYGSQEKSWIVLEGLLYEHPARKFKLIN